MSKPSKLTVFITMLVANIIGIPTRYGFRLKPTAFVALSLMEQELESLRVRYDYALQVNQKQSDQLTQLYALTKEIKRDAAQMSKALKELSNHPNILSKDTQLILEGYRFKNEQV